MPWVNQEMCNGCGICIDECPVEAITLKSTKSHAFVVQSAMMFVLRMQCDMIVKKFRSR